MEHITLKEDYTLANCCHPEPNDRILGYYSHDNIIKVHRATCTNIETVETSRLLHLTWEEIILKEDSFTPEMGIWEELDKTDFMILSHHLTFGIDYSHVVARKCNISKQDAFDRHRKLRELGLINRVDSVMVQYRKGIVDNKWIKHRNHTYYELSESGKAYLRYYQETGKNG